MIQRNVPRKAPVFARVRAHAQQGMALIESLIAILILAIGLIGTLGLQINSQKVLAEAAMRSEATMAASELIGVMSTDLDHLEEYALAKDEEEPDDKLKEWRTALIDRLPNSTVEVTVTPVEDTERTQVEIDISWQRDPDAPANSHRILTYISRSA